MTRENVLDALQRFKVLQDTENAAKFVAIEQGKSLVDDTSIAGLTDLLSKNVLTVEQFKTLLNTCLLIIDSQTNTEPVTTKSTTPAAKPTTTTVDKTTSNDGYEEITDDDLASLFK